MGQSPNLLPAEQVTRTTLRTTADGEQLYVPLGELDANPYQPRTQMDAAELEELKASIRIQGLIQPIVVRPKEDGRFVVVAGHRRTEAFRQLLAAAGSPEERAKYGTIPAIARHALDDGQLASMALAENTDRSNLTPMEEARALDRMLEAGLAQTNEDLAKLTGRPPRTIQRLRRLAKAPRCISTAVDAGLMVVISKEADGRERRELRRLDLMPALQFLALHELLVKQKTHKVAEERTEAAVRRALAGAWSLRRIEQYVQGCLRGRTDEEAATPEAPIKAPSAAKVREPVGLFVKGPRRFVIDVGRLRAAGTAEREALKMAFAELLTEASRP